MQKTQPLSPAKKVGDLNLDQFVGSIHSLICDFEENCGGIEEEYGMSFEVHEDTTWLKVVLHYCYKILEFQNTEDNRPSESVYTEYEFVILKSEKMYTLHKYVHDSLEYITKDKVYYESK